LPVPGTLLTVIRDNPAGGFLICPFGSYLRFQMRDYARKYHQIATIGEVFFSGTGCGKPDKKTAFFSRIPEYPKSSRIPLLGFLLNRYLFFGDKL